MSLEINPGDPRLRSGVTQPVAARGQASWDEIVDAYAGSVWAVARREQLTSEEAASVSQLTWLRLADRLDYLSPEAIGSWLEETARRESTRVARLVRASGEDEARPA
jgi:hypothetical protein